MQFRPSKLLFILFDICLLALSAWAAYSIRLERIPLTELLTVKIFFGSLAVLSIYYIFGAYSYLRPKFIYADALLLFIASILSGVVITSFIYFTQVEGKGLLGRGIVSGALALFWLGSVSYRWVFLNLISRSNQSKHFLILCEPEYYQSFLKDLEKSGRGERYSFIMPDHQPDSKKSILGGFEEFQSVASDKRRKWTGLVVGLNSTHISVLEEKLMHVRISGLPVYSLSDYYEEAWEKLPIYTLNRTWFVFTSGFRLVKSSFRFRIKRLMDILLSVSLLILTLPLQFFVYILVAMTSKGSAIFRQQRTGEFGQVFSIIKFRTMKLGSDKGKPSWTISRDKRITGLGKILRRTRLDELPQIINVLKGEMSFIGPRPERPEFDKELGLQIPFYDLRYQVKPGITGWAQVSYPYGASIEDAKEKLQYDLYYIKNYSVVLDLVILLKTIRVVLGWKGR